MTKDQIGQILIPLCLFTILCVVFYCTRHKQQVLPGDTFLIHTKSTLTVIVIYVGLETVSYVEKKNLGRGWIYVESNQKRDFFNTYKATKMSIDYTFLQRYNSFNLEIEI